MTAADLPTSPALVIQVPEQDARLAWVRDLNGEPVVEVRSGIVRLVGIRWADNAGLSGWSECAGGYWRPDLRTAAGQAWQRQLNALRWPVVSGAFEKFTAKK